MKTTRIAARGPDRPAKDPELSAIEWQAVAIALRDAATDQPLSQPKPGGFRHFYEWVTGAASPQPLANPRLEAVRSFVADSGRYRRINLQLAEPLASLGFNQRQIEALGLLSLA